MSIEVNIKEYYINGYGIGAHGPLRALGIRVNLVYGKPNLDDFSPVDAVKPIEKAFELLKYSDPTKQNYTYITRHNPLYIVWGKDEYAEPVPATPELNRVFDELLPKWKHEKEQYRQRNLEAYNKAIQRAGLNWPKAIKLLEEDRKKHTKRYHNEFYLKVLEHIDKIPEPLLVKVEGLDEILDQIEVNQTLLSNTATIK